MVSLLRLKHNMKAEVCQLTGCDYIVSNRMAVKRKTASGNLVVAFTFCENHSRGVTAQRLCETLRNKFEQKKFVKPKRRACLILSRGNLWVYPRTMLLFFLSGWHGVLSTRERCYFSLLNLQSNLLSMATREVAKYLHYRGVRITGAGIV